MSVIKGAINLISIISDIATIKRFIVIITGGLIVIDVSNIVIPSEYLVGIAMTALVLGALFGVWISLWLHEKAADEKLAKGKIQSTADLPFDNRYIAASVVGTVVGMLIAVFGTPIIVQNCINGGEMWSYIAITAILTPILTTVFVCLFQWGVREFIVRFKDYRYILKETASEALTDEEKAIVNNYLLAHGKKPKF